jgi:multiple sugar transport system ATP-binding protein
VLVHFTIEAPPVLTEDVKELAHDVGTEALREVELGAKAGRSRFVARLSPRTQVAQGEPVELVVDAERLHFFDPRTGLGIYGGDS